VWGGKGGVFLSPPPFFPQGRVADEKERGGGGGGAEPLSVYRSGGNFINYSSSH